MKRFFTLITTLLLFVFFPGMLFAQGKNDYNILLNSGKFTPTENVTTLSKNSSFFIESKFNDRHYLTIQFNALPDEVMKARLSVAGIQLVDYIPNLAYTASVPATIDLNTLKTFNIRSVFQFDPSQKTVPDILIKKVPPHAIKSPGYADIDLLLYEKLSADKILSSLVGLGANIIADVPIFRMFTVRVPLDKLPELVALPFVQWAEFIGPPNVLENLPGRTLHRTNILNDGVRNLKGDGINIGIWDGGQVSTTHIDFSPIGRVTVVRAGSISDHATHVAGTITGKGIGNPIARGMAPNANLFNWDFNIDIQSEMATAIPNNNLLVSNHSYGSIGTPGCTINDPLLVYNITARNTDINLNNNSSHLHVHSSGNAGTICSGGFYTITGSGKPAKNNLVVAHISTAEAIAGTSSSGPVQDGRIKPEISAMGGLVFSTWIPNNNSYATASGTSMATPGVTGSAALLFQRYKQLNGNAIPPSSLIKNIICNTAQDLGNPGPDYRYGFGRINALAAVRILEQNRYAVTSVSTGFTNDISITVPAGAAHLRVMLTWNDPAAASNSSLALVNNLDLRVIEGVNTTLPWILDPNNPSTNATQADDNISNIEQVTINNPTAGTYTLRVIGEAVPSGANQVYALTWDVNQPYIEVIYPNGGESFSPGASQVITWDNAGVTSNQTIEYSLDNGGSWTTFGVVGPTTTRLTWTVPAANTSTALIRISSGAITDVSDATFNILGTVTGFNTSGVSCNAGEVSFIWNTVTNATHFDIYNLDAATGQFVILASNVTGTSYTATGLTPGASMWFTIVAKNNTTNAISERANAINRTVSTAGGGLGTIGSITGQTIICGTPSGVAYSISAVSGATTYTWTAPPGASIASGQGTASITINYLAGSTDGNVSVFAGNGTCVTSTSTLAITIGSASIAAPTSGGNQSVTVCPGGVVPTLTATATVPGGHTVVWYNAATGGSIVGSPTLSAAGTVTYHAASRNNTSGCESNTRTAVTLTIIQVQAATITAGGPTTFCQGGSVMLTATAGSSYLWNNGATTQSITVSANGSFNVTVFTGSCESTSPNTTVTVNPVPAANITAGGPTTFCQGLNVVLTASAGSSWLWSNGATTQSTTVSSSNNYSVTVTNASGCSATSAATTVTVNPNPAAVITASGTTTFCNGGSVMLTANAGVSYLWSNGATTQSITVNSPIGATNYTVQVTQAGGCVSTSPATTVTVNPIPVANVTAGGTTTFCQGSNVVLTASAGNSWLWSNGATTQSITVGTTGNYSVTVTSAAGCSATSLATSVSVSPSPVVNISASPYTRLFPGLSTTLTANVTPPGSYIYAWFKNGVLISGAATATLTGIDLDDLGSYTVTVTNATGLPCSNTSPALVIADSATTKLFIYPSPTDGQFSVRYYTTGGNSKYKLVIIDSKGANVYTREYTINSSYQIMAVDMRRNGKGIYRVALFDASGKRVATGSVVIQ